MQNPQRRLRGRYFSGQALNSFKPWHLRLCTALLRRTHDKPPVSISYFISKSIKRAGTPVAPLSSTYWYVRIEPQEPRLGKTMVLKEDEFMSKRLIAVLGAAMLLLSLTVVAVAQKKKTTTIQTSEGVYTIVEYPTGKETVVTLNPVGLAGATGRATILRDPNADTIKLNLTSLPPDVTSMNVYAIDPTGAPVLLGQVEVNSGIGTFTTTTPLTQFMLVASPEAALTPYDANTKIYFRSAVPTGLTVIPITSAVGEQVAAVVPTETVAVTSDYVVPMLGIPNYTDGDETKLKINFSVPLEAARRNISIKPQQHRQPTEVLI